MENKIYGFDYAKIIAASFIVLHHYQQVFGCSFDGINFYKGRIVFGYFVELFFTISGFLTLYSEQRQMSVRGGQRLIHKLLRIYPMVFLSVLICLLLKTGVSIVTTDGQLMDLWNVKTLIANFGLLFAGYHYFEMLGINNPVWYVCVLIQCYVLFYLLECCINNFEKKSRLRLTVYLLTQTSHTDKVC